MEKQCPKCGGMMPETASFCPNCGTPSAQTPVGQGLSNESRDTTQLIDESVNQDVTQLSDNQSTQASCQHKPLVQEPVLPPTTGPGHVNPQMSEADDEPQVEVKHRSNTRLYVIIAILSVLLVGGVVGFIWWNQKKDADNKAAVERLRARLDDEDIDQYSGDVETVDTVKTAQGLTMVVINGTDVHLRVSPSTGAGWLTWSDGGTRSVPKDSKLEYAGDYGDWYAVRYDGQKLYVSKQFSYLSYDCAPGEAYTGSGTRPTTTAGTKSPSTYSTSGSSSSGGVVINGEGVRMRFSPNFDSGWLTWSNGQTRSVSKGTRLEYAGDYGDWYAVRYQGNIFYVSKDYSYRVN